MKPLSKAQRILADANKKRLDKMYSEAVGVARLHKQTCGDCGHRWNAHDKDGCHAGDPLTGLKCIGCGGFKRQKPLDLPVKISP